MSPGEGFGVRFNGVVGGVVFLWKKREKGKGELAKEQASQCAHVCQNYPLADCPLVSLRCFCFFACLDLAVSRFDCD